MPDAAHHLAQYGVIPLKDLVLDNEISQALYESSPIQANAP
jgi:hypothetical protein